MKIKGDIRFSITSETVKIPTFTCNPKNWGIFLVKMEGGKWLSFGPNHSNLRVFQDMSHNWSQRVLMRMFSNPVELRRQKLFAQAERYAHRI